MITVRRLGLGIGLLAALAMVGSQVASVLAAPPSKAVVGTAYQTSGSGNVGPSDYLIIADMVLPAGKYHVTAKGLVNNQTGSPVNVISCNAFAGTTNIDVGDTSAPMQYASISIDAPADLPSGGTVKVQCISDSFTAPYPGVYINLVAVSVANIVALP